MSKQPPPAPTASTIGPCPTKAGNHVVLMIGFTEFRAGIRTKPVRK